MKKKINILKVHSKIESHFQELKQLTFHNFMMDRIGMQRTQD